MQYLSSDDLARVFQACDVVKLMERFGKLTGQNDPLLHFYDTFLAANNPMNHESHGVWYKPTSALINTLRGPPPSTVSA